MTALPPQRLGAVITPMVDLGLPLVGAFAREQALLLQLLERFQPRWVLASSAGGHTQDSRLLWRRGSTATAGGPAQPPRTADPAGGSRTRPVLRALPPA